MPSAAEALWALTVGFNRLWGALVEEAGWSKARFRQFYGRVHHATFVTPPQDRGAHDTIRGVNLSGLSRCHR